MEEHKIEDNDPESCYCKECGACGEDGCCPASMCTFGDNCAYKGTYLADLKYEYSIAQELYNEIYRDENKYPELIKLHGELIDKWHKIIYCDRLEKGEENLKNES